MLLVRPPADHAFHISQLLIILDRTDSLLEGFANGLQEGAYDPSSIEYPTMTRFFAHLCLFLQMIDISVPPLATQVILEAYLQVLEVSPPFSPPLSPITDFNFLGRLRAKETL